MILSASEPYSLEVNPGMTIWYQTTYYTKDVLFEEWMTEVLQRWQEFHIVFDDVENVLMPVQSTVARIPFRYTTIPIGGFTARSMIWICTPITVENSAA